MIEVNDLNLIDPKFLQEIQNRFSDATGLAAFITDADGKNIIPESNQTEFCKKVKKSISATTKCKNCYKTSGSAAMSSGRGYTCCCHAGLYEIAAPIIVNGELIGTFVAGQVLAEPVSRTSAQKYAQDLGMGIDDYIEATSKVKVVSENQLKNYSNLLYSIAELISSKAYNEYISRMSSDGDSFGDTTNMLTKLSEAKSLVKTNSNTLEKLRHEFTQLETIARTSVSEVNSTKETVKVIQNVAMNTRILGFNAYIEAARAKEYGKSFGVITQEIRDLADKSKESADKIEDAMESISKFTTQIDTQVRNTEALLSSCVQNIEKFSMILNTLMSQSGN